MDKPLTWDNILNTNHTWIGIRVEAVKLSRGLNYPYYVWNDRIYPTGGGPAVGFIDNKTMAITAKKYESGE